MAEVKVQVEAEAPEVERKPAMEMVRKVLLAGIGAVALTQEEVEKIIKRLIERGELAQQDGQKLVKEMVDRRRKETKKVEDEMDKRIETVMGKMNVPTKADIEALSAKITLLTKKVDELKKG
jgi:poly(hydroxyalkanoate) granule-associated protein